MKNLNVQHIYNKKGTSSYSVGAYPTIELLTYQPQSVIEVMFHGTGRKNSGVEKLQELCMKHKIRFNQNDGFINKISDKENVYAVGVFNKFTSELNSQSNHLMLVNPSDMGNVGTIMRTMLAFNIKDLALMRPAVDVFNPKVIRASMGALFQLNMVYFDSIDQYKAKFPHHLYAFMTGSKQLLNQVRFQSPHTLVFGNEANGLPDSYRKVGTVVTIPQSQSVDSLNVGIAVGIGLYAANQSSK